MTKELGIRLTAKETISKALGKVGGAVSKATSALKTIPAIAGKAGKALGDMAMRGVRALTTIAEKAFFLREALNTLVGVLGGLFNALLKPAIRAKKTETAIANLTDSTQHAAMVMDSMRQTALKTGVSLQELYSAAPDAVSMITKQQGAFDPQQWNAYLAAITKVAKFRPDLSAAKQIGIVNEMIAGNLATAAESLGQAEERVREAVTTATETQLGQHTSVVKQETQMSENIVSSAMAVNDALESMGIGNAIMKDTTSILDKLRARWEVFKESIGLKVLDKFVEMLGRVMDWLEQNEDMVMRVADKFAEWIEGGIQKIIEFIDGGGIESLIAQFQEFVGVLGEVWAVLEPILSGIGAGIGGTPGEFKSEKFGGRAAEAVTQTITRPRAAMERAGTTATQIGGILGAKLGGLFGPEGAKRGLEFGQNFVRGQYGMQQQKVEVVVSVDPRSGSVAPYVKDQIYQNNWEMASGMAAWTNR